MMDRSLRALPGAQVVETEVAEEPPRFDDFFESEHVRLFRALCLVTGDRFEAEEIMQDSFLRLLERWERVGGLDDPSAYLFRTAMNVFRNRYRRATLGLRRTLTLAPTEDAFANVDLPIFGEDGTPMHDRGVVTGEPGLYFVGLPFQYSAGSDVLPGVGRDAAYVVRHLVRRSTHEIRRPEAEVAA